MSVPKWPFSRNVKKDSYHTSAPACYSIFNSPSCPTQKVLSFVLCVIRWHFQPNETVGVVFTLRSSKLSDFTTGKPVSSCCLQHYVNLLSDWFIYGWLLSFVLLRSIFASCTRMNKQLTFYQHFTVLLYFWQLFSSELQSKWAIDF